MDCQCWQKKNDKDSEDDITEIKSSVEYIATVFREPLQATAVNTTSLQDELEEVFIDYARRYLSIDKESYRHIWYKLHTSPDTGKWPNILVLCELLFALHFSNGKVERIFSITKTERSTNLDVSTLSDLLEIKVEGPELKPVGFI